MEITLQVPDELGQELQQYQNRLVEILELGLQSVVAQASGSFSDENAILELLASQPDPAKVLALQPSAEMQERVSNLLRIGKERSLTTQEETELNRYLLLEHLVRLAKAHASRQQLTSKP